MRTENENALMDEVRWSGLSRIQDQFPTRFDVWLFEWGRKMDETMGEEEWTETIERAMADLDDLVCGFREEEEQE